MYPRFLAPAVKEALSDTPVVFLEGARQVGKSTLAQMLVPEAACFSMDDLGVFEAARRDPVGFVRDLPVPALLDEVQRVPELLLSVKAAVDRDRRPGRLLMTGSANVLLLPRVADSLAGRMSVRRLWPLSQGEIAGQRSDFLAAAFGTASPFVAFENADNMLERVLLGGFPSVLTRVNERRRDEWFQDYLNALVQRDIRDLANPAGLTDLPRLLRALAARVGSLLNWADVARDANLNAQTLRRYFALLEATFLVYSLPAWARNTTKRLAKAPKLHFTDSGLAASLLGASRERLERDRALFGSLLETFVAAELGKQLGWSRVRARLYHYRTHAGQEVDFVLEDASGRVVGVEVKAAATVTSGDARGLRALAEDAGAAFHRGFVLYWGDPAVPLGNGMFALPHSALWSWSLAEG